MGASEIAETLDQCTSGQRRECHSRGRDMGRTLGFKPHHYGAIKMLAIKQRLAQAMAACLEETSEASSCKSEAEGHFVTWTGFDAAAFSEIEESVERLAN